MFYLGLIRSFARASAQQELAYRANFFISLLHTLLNLATGVIGLAVLFHQVESIRGWDFATALAVLGIYLTLNALRALCFDPSMNALTGLGGAIWHGTFDFTLLRPLNPQFMVSFQQWRPLALFDLLLGVGVLLAAIGRLEQALSLVQVAWFLLSLAASVTILYSLLLGFTSLVFWGEGFFYTWLFDGLIQMARYPVQLYPGWLRLILTWIIPVGLMTTLPARVLAGPRSASPALLLVVCLFALVLFLISSHLFHTGLRRYASASS